jgi:hypothetical protein
METDRINGVVLHHQTGPSGTQDPGNVAVCTNECMNMPVVWGLVLA